MKIAPHFLKCGATKLFAKQLLLQQVLSVHNQYLLEAHVLIKLTMIYWNIYYYIFSYFNIN